MTDGPKVDVVLIHGAMHGAWCWERVIPFLQADPRVAVVRAIDLPGHGEEVGRMPTDEITLDDYVDEVVRTIEQGALRNIVLVGHSLGGITITPVADRVPDRIERLVYLTTICPPAGADVLSMVFGESRPEMQGGQNPPDMFCTDFDDATTEWLVSRLVDQPPLPMTAPIAVATPPAGIPATYILCEHDEALTTPFQREQAAQVGARIVTLDAGHSPFATHPEALAALILEDV